MSAQHSTILRGLAAAGRDPNFQGRFGRLFPNLQPASFGATEEEEQANLAKLAGLMVSDFDGPKDAPDAGKVASQRCIPISASSLTTT